MQELVNLKALLLVKCPQYIIQEPLAVCDDYSVYESEQICEEVGAGGHGLLGVVLDKVGGRQEDELLEGLKSKSERILPHQGQILQIQT